jgi:hypothetical protein
MKAKTNRQKQPEKKAPKKARRLRTDQAQKKPVFAEFTNTWGLAGRKWWDTEASWFSQKIQHGKFLHPLITSIVGELQNDYQSSALQFLSSTHIRESDVSNEVFWKWHKIHKKYQNQEPLEQDEQQYLKVWLTMLAESQKRMEQLGKIVAGAVACGDIALLKHLILIMQSHRKRTDKPANLAVAAIKKAYENIVLRRQTDLLQKSRPGLKGCAARLAVAKTNAELLKHIQLPDKTDIDDEIMEDSELKILAPQWGKTSIDSRFRQIQRICKDLGQELLGKRTRRNR